MAGFLDESYGVGEERRERLVKRLLICVVAALIVGGAVYLTFRNWRQEQVVKQFLTLLQQKDYQAAYKLWGCTPETPCKYYPPEQFNEDWGPSSPFANAAAAKIIHVDACGAGVVFNVTAADAGGVGLWVERDTNVISFAPWQRCPGRHLQLWEFLKSRFG
jgi:limonene-1,2-epoxide hydrolase